MEMDVSARRFSGTLNELWNDSGVLDAAPGEWLAPPDVLGLLRLGPVHFVFADPGLPLRWIDLPSCYRFWKDEVKAHLAHRDARVRLEDMPGEYFYVAQHWLPGDMSAPIVVLLRSH